MKKNPLVSVIVPTYKEEKYIEATLRSIKNQDYKGEYEIIVVDSNSKDRTVKIAKKYADRVIVTKKKGIAHARNLGAKVAKGEILLFMDADTFLWCNGLKEIVKAFEEENVVGVTCPLLPSSAKFYAFLYYNIYNQFCKNSLRKKPQVAGSIIAYRREAFFRVNGFDEKLKILEDFDLSERIGKLGKIKFVETTFAITSARRLEKWGLINVPFKYLFIYFLYVFTNGRIASSVGGKMYKPIR